MTGRFRWHSIHLGKQKRQRDAVGSEQNIGTFERLKFEAPIVDNNGNGRIKDEQNHVVVMELKAKLKTETFVTVATQTSSPMIVRNKSKSSYGQTNRDVSPVLHISDQMANQSVPSSSSYCPSAMPQLDSGHSDDRTPLSSPQPGTSHITETSSISSTSRLITPSDSPAKRSSFLSLFPCIGWLF
ncbi:hypothetical protein G6F56_011835 [Rhizopus delemar]|nr:hypothetical protein G6F56_011835 [Rhizopus delemar]